MKSSFWLNLTDLFLCVTHVDHQFLKLLFLPFSQVWSNNRQIGTFDLEVFIFKITFKSNVSVRARTESIHYDSPKWIKNKKMILANQNLSWIKIFLWFVIHLSESFYFWFWIILIYFRIKNQIESKIKGRWIVFD